MPEIVNEFLLVVDLEATCDRVQLPNSEREIIEIGAVLVRAESLKIEGEFSSLVRPVRHPILTEYCRELTGIEQSSIDEAPGFGAAFHDFVRATVSGRDVLLASWGSYDKHQIATDCGSHGVTNPFTEHLDLSLSFTRAVGLSRRPSMKKALELTRSTVQGQAHRALDDAKNLVQLLPWCLGRAELPSLD